MKNIRPCLLLSLSLAVLAPQTWAQNRPKNPDPEARPPGRPGVMMQRLGEEGTEKVTFLGIETAPVDRTLGVQLGMTRDTGLVVVHVMTGSPAAEGLKDNDVLTRLDDQILVNQPQLAVLVRNKAEGEEVKLTVIRAGKELAVRVKLGVHDVPKSAGNIFFRNGMPGGIDWQAAGPELPGMGPNDTQDVLRMIERERGNVLTGPGIRIMNRRGGGSTVLNLPDSNISFSTDEGGIEIKFENKQRILTIKDASGKVTFEGPITTEEERTKLPPGVKQRLEKLDIDAIRLEFMGEDFRPEVLPMAPEPGKIGRQLGPVSEKPHMPRPL